MTLYDIDARIAALVDPETGELLDYDAFSQLQIDRDQLIENMALWYKDLKAEAAAIKAEAEALTERRKAAERRADRLREHLDRALDGQKFTTARCSISFRTSSSVQLENAGDMVTWLETNGYDDAITYKPPEVSKTAIGKLLKSGVNVPGAWIETKRGAIVK